MPVYDYHCPKCSRYFAIFKPMGEYDKSEWCPDCGAQSYKIIHAISTLGASRGPGCGSSEIVFDRPDPLKDGQITLRKMEEAGQLKDPKTRAMAMAKLNAIKVKPPKKVDYGKDGHPIERN